MTSGYAALMRAVRNHPDPILVDRAMLATYLGVNDRRLRYLIETKPGLFIVRGSRRSAKPGRPQLLYDLRPVAEAYDLLTKGGEQP